MVRCSRPLCTKLHFVYNERAHMCLANWHTVHSCNPPSYKAGWVQTWWALCFGRAPGSGAHKHVLKVEGYRVRRQGSTETETRVPAREEEVS